MYSTSTRGWGWGFLGIKGPLLNGLNCGEALRGLNYEEMRVESCGIRASAWLVRKSRLLQVRVRVAYLAEGVM